MSVMKVVPPVEVTPDKMISNNVPDADYPAWVAGTYTQGDRRIVGINAYEVLAQSTTDSPLDGIAKAVPSWLDLGPINRWRMFRKRAGNTWSIGTYTENPESIDVTIRPGARINSFGLVGVRASSVQVQMIIDGEVVYDQTFAMSLKAGGSYYRYYFGPFVTKDNVARFDLPPFANADIRVVASAPGGVARIGMFVIGMGREIGIATYGTGLGTESYSSVNEDAFGNVTIVPRGKRRFVDFDIVMRGDQLSSALRTLEPLSDTAALYVGAEEIDPTIIVGRFERLALVLTTFNRAEYTLEVRSLI